MSFTTVKLVFFNPFSAQLIVDGNPQGTIALAAKPASETSLKIGHQGRHYWINDTSALAEPVISALRTLYPA